jgi:hypothetical protein|tara:strand:- start:1070 stop:1846 length:777 start_codon:yes stop_codon:yes gene_type:complete
MATVNLGNIKFNWKGAYNGSTAYVVDDVVSSSGSSYICIAASTGNAPTNTSYWQQMSAAGTNGTDVGTTITTQGDILYRDASGLARLAAGTSGQFLKTLGTGANPTWGDVAGGVVQVKIMTPTSSSVSTSSNTFVDSNMSVAITPTSSSNRILLYNQTTMQGTGGRSFYTFKREGHPSTNGDLNDIVHSNSSGMLSSEGINGEGNDCMSLMFIDNPATTSALTYKFRFRNHNSDSTTVNNGGSINYMFAMELDGGLFT